MGDGSPAYYVQQVLSGHGSILDIWRDAPTFNNHVSTFNSGRSDGSTGYVDPDTRDSGYYHSVVVRGHASAQSVLAGAGKIAAGRRILPALRYSLLRANAHPATIGSLHVQRGPVAGKSLAVTLPIMSKPKSLPDSGLQLAVRWDPMTVDPPRHGVTPTDPRTPDDPNSIWIAPEEPGKVVQTEIAKITGRSIQAKVMVPSQPGLYRLTIALANGDGAPLGPRVVKQPAAYLVTVPARLDIGFTVASQVRAIVGRQASLPLTITNSGSAPWIAAGQDAKGLQVGAWLVPVSQPLTARIAAAVDPDREPRARRLGSRDPEVPGPRGPWATTCWCSTSPAPTARCSTRTATRRRWSTSRSCPPPPPPANDGDTGASPKPSPTPSQAPKGPQSPSSPAGT